MKKQKIILIEIMEKLKDHSNFARNVLLLLKNEYCTDDLINSIYKLVTLQKEKLFQNGHKV